MRAVLPFSAILCFGLAACWSEGPRGDAGLSDLAAPVDLGRADGAAGGDLGGDGGCLGGCRAFASTCASQACVCLALPQSDADPSCDAGMVSCLTDPCAGRTACRTSTGMCELR